VIARSQQDLRNLRSGGGGTLIFCGPLAQKFLLLLCAQLQLMDKLLNIAYVQ